MNKFLSPSPIWQQAGLFLIRITIGIFLIIHGKEVFDTGKMQEYAKWDMFKSSFMPYLGKGAEFVAGVLLLLGLFTRAACLITIGTFAYIVFFIGKGKFWMEDQHPFLFVLFGLVFFFTGPGAWSLDGVIFKNNKRSN
jgi:putative oxidoreductase